VEGNGKWWMDDADKKLIERYESLVVEGHDESCLWRKSGCKGWDYEQPFHRDSTADLLQMTSTESDSQIKLCGRRTWQRDTLPS
jgi:hypothetical protein